jgi:hypothetical protein
MAVPIAVIARFKGDRDDLLERMRIGRLGWD